MQSKPGPLMCAGRTTVKRGDGEGEVLSRGVWAPKEGGHGPPSCTMVAQ